MNRPDSNSADQSANRDEDAVWLDLVARLEATDSSSVGSPDEPTLPGRAVIPEVDSGSASPPSSGVSFQDFDPLGLSRRLPAEPPELEPSGMAEPGPRDYEADDDEGFVPEEPPSLEGVEPLVVLAWLGAVGGPIALLLSAMFWRSAPLAAILGIVAAFAASVIFLIMRLPQEKDDNDDGARV